MIQEFFRDRDKDKDKQCGKEVHGREHGM